MGSGRDAAGVQGLQHVELLQNLGQLGRESLDLGLGEGDTGQGGDMFYL